MKRVAYYSTHEPPGYKLPSDSDYFTNCLSTCFNRLRLNFPSCVCVSVCATRSLSVDVHVFMWAVFKLKHSEEQLLFFFTSPSLPRGENKVAAVSAPLIESSNKSKPLQTALQADEKNNINLHKVSPRTVFLSHQLN